MYAVIETGGKQYRVELGAEIQVDRLDVRPGDAVTLDRVLLVADGDATAVGQPHVAGASVSAEVLRQERGEKVVVFKYKPKARTRVKQGHRAELTTLRIADIAFGGKSAAKEAQQAETRKSKAAREAEQQAEAKAAADRDLAARLASAAEVASDVEPEKPATKRAPRRKATEPEASPGAEATEPAATTAEAAALAEAEAEAAAPVEAPVTETTTITDGELETPAAASEGGDASDAKKDE